MPGKSNVVEVNRAPVLTLWAAVVAKHLGYDEDAALMLGRAVAGLNAQAKGRRLGIFKPGVKLGQRPGDGLNSVAVLCPFWRHNTASVGFQATGSSSPRACGLTWNDPLVMIWKRRSRRWKPWRGIQAGGTEGCVLWAVREVPAQHSQRKEGLGNEGQIGLGPDSFTLNIVQALRFPRPSSRYRIGPSSGRSKTTVTHPSVIPGSPLPLTIR